MLIDPEFADGAHSTNENDTGSPTTRQLKNIANRLNIDYALLAAQLDSNPGSGNVQQSNPVAISITRSVSGNYNSPGIPTFQATRGVGGWPDIENGGPGFCFPIQRWNGTDYINVRWKAYQPGACAGRR